MALSFTAAEANVLRHFYLVYMRLTGTAIAAGDYANLTAWNAFLANFDLIGCCENENIKIDEVPDVIAVDYGKELAIGYDGNVEIKFVQNQVADFTAITNMRAADCDMLIIDTINKVFHYIHDKLFESEKHINSGTVPFFTIKTHQIAGEASGAYGIIYLTETIPSS